MFSRKVVLALGLLTALLHSSAHAQPLLQKVNVAVGGKPLQFVEDPTLVYVWRPLRDSEATPAERKELARNLASDAVNAQSRLANVADATWASLPGRAGPVIALNAPRQNNHIGSVVRRHAAVAPGRIADVLEGGAKTAPVFRVEGFLKPVFFDRWIILRSRGVLTEEQRTMLENLYKVQITRGYERNWYVQLSVDSPTPLQLAEELRGFDYVESAENTFGYVSGPRCTTVETRTVPGLSGISHLNQMRLARAWSQLPMTGDLEPVRVAVLDTGIDLNHPALRDALLPGRDYLDDGAGGLIGPDPHYHGTACAGLIAARPPAPDGFEGIAARAGVKIIPYRIAGDDGTVTDTPVIRALTEILQTDRSKRPRILSCSFDVNFDSNGVLGLATYSRLLQQMDEENLLVICAAGNSGNDLPVSFPASYSTALAVGAVNSLGAIWGYSQGRNEANGTVDLVAPSGSGDLCANPAAEGIWTLDLSGAAGRHKGAGTAGDYFGLFSGTSASTPMVAGTAALVWSVRPDLTVQNVRCILEKTALKVPTANGYANGGKGRKVLYGYGLICADRAVELALKKNPDGSFAIAANDGCTSDIAVAEASLLADSDHPADSDKSEKPETIGVPIAGKVREILTNPAHRVIRVRRSAKLDPSSVLKPDTVIPKKPVWSYQGVEYYVVDADAIRSDWKPDPKSPISVDDSLDLSSIGGKKVGWFTGDIICSFNSQTTRDQLISLGRKYEMKVLVDTEQSLIFHPIKAEKPSKTVLFPALDAMSKVNGASVYPDFPRPSKNFDD